MPSTALPARRPARLSQHEELVHSCALLGARLAATLREPGCTRTDVAALLAEVPAGRTDVLAVVLAAMVNDEASPGSLLAWTTQLRPRRRSSYRPTGRPPGRPRLPREHGTERGYLQHRTHDDPPCPPCLAAHTVTSRPAVCRAEYARLVASGVAPVTAAELTRPSRLQSAPIAVEELAA